MAPGAANTQNRKKRTRNPLMLLPCSSIHFSRHPSCHERGPERPAPPQLGFPIPSNEEQPRWKRLPPPARSLCAAGGPLHSFRLSSFGLGPAPGWEVDLPCPGEAPAGARACTEHAGDGARPAAEVAEAGRRSGGDVGCGAGRGSMLSPYRRLQGKLWMGGRHWRMQ